MRGLLDLFDSYSYRSSRSEMCRHLLLWLVLLLIHSTLTQDMSAGPTAPNVATTTTKTGFETPITNLEFITELETLLPTESTEIILAGTLTTSLLMDTAPTARIGETSFTEITNISSTELITRMRPLCCPEGFLDVEENCFRFENDEANFDGALDRCNFSSGGSLAKIDPIEPTTQYLLDITRYYSDSELIWIGLRRSEDSNDTFTWTFDETTLNISNWADGEPITNSSVNCATMSRNGTWVLRPCGETYLPYICQSPPVFCAELTTAPEVTTEEFTTAEITEIITNATTTTVATTTTAATTMSTTKAATTNRSTIVPTTLATTTKTSTLLKTTKLTRKPETTTDKDDEVTTEMMTEEETTKKSTTAPSLSMTNKTISPVPTSDGNITTNVTIVRPEGSTSRRNPTTTSQTTVTTAQPRPPLSPINKILIAIIVIFVVLAIIIGCMVLYLIYKRKKSKQAVYNVKDVEMELEDIKSVEDLSGPSTSSGSGVANTSFISDDMPGFSGAHFSGLKGKSFSLDITSHSEA